MSASRPPARARRTPGSGFLVPLAVCLALVALLPIGPVGAVDTAIPEHLVISEVVTGGASASDELVELYNPTVAPLPLEGLEVVYASASGATVTRRATWPAGAPSVPSGAHVLLANELGAYAGIADVLFAGGMAATGGSVVIRIQGAETAIDAVGWGTAASTWMEGAPAAAPTAGSSIERLPGGAAGSTRDTDDNAADFLERTLPDPQNAGSPPVPDPAASPTPSTPPSASASPTPTPMPTPTLAPTLTPTSTPQASPTAQPSSTPGSPAPSASGTPNPPSPSASPSPTSVSVADARAASDGSTVTVQGVSLTSSGFTDGGGYLADETGGIAILVADGGFDAGRLLRVTGTVDDRFAQRTIRAAVADIADLGGAEAPDPTVRETGLVGEELEGQLVAISGQIVGSPTTLSGGLAYDVDDGSGAVRVVVGTLTGIDTSPWASGRSVELVGVAGQRDSSGTGASGYRVLPRGPLDMVSLADASPSAIPSASSAPTATPSASAEPIGVVSVADARAAEKNARVRVRGVVTLGSGLLEGSAVIQDATGAILLRLSDEAGTVERGDLVDASGARSTKSGMETIRVSLPPTSLGATSEPQPRAVRTGEASESFEAILVVARGAVVASPRRASSGTTTFDLDDGSGPLRVVIGGALDADIEGLEAGAWIEVRGVLGQETTGAQPMRGYRLWPRDADDLRVLAPATDGEPATPVIGDDRGGRAGTTGARGGAADDVLPGLDGADGGLTVGATLVAGPWPELGLGGLLWDGTALVGLEPAAAELLPGTPTTVPRPLEMRGLRVVGEHSRLGVAIHALDPAPGAVVPGASSPHPPATQLPGREDGARWVSLVGRLEPGESGLQLVVAGREVALELVCRGAERPTPGTVGVLGVGLAGPEGIVVPCGGIRPASLLEVTSGGPGTRIALAGAREAEDGPVVEPTTVPPERTLAAALLATGALGLLAAGWLARRLRKDPQGLQDEAEADAPAPTDDEDPAAELAVGPSNAPRLVLVPLPRDRGSP